MSVFVTRAVAENIPEDRGFLEYHEPTVIPLLTLISFFVLLGASEWLAGAVFKAGLIGHIIVGLIYGTPIGNILALEWQQTFVDLGGLTVRLDLLKKNFLLSVCAACVGILTPIGLCYLLMYLGYGYGAVETFIVGAALSATSLGTTFVVMSGANTGLDFVQTRVGIVLVSAALLDDISGLIMVSVIHQLGPIADNPSINIGWIIGRPIVASVALAALTPLICKFLFSPLFRRYLEPHLPRFKHASNMVLMTVVLSAFIAISSYAGASVLYGSFLAGAFLSGLPSTHSDGPFAVESREQGEAQPGKMPTFVHSFERYLHGAQTYVLQPLFFASIGFAIPFSKLWTGEAIWRGLVATVVMVIAKAAVGMCVPVGDLVGGGDRRGVLKRTWKPATFLGMAMVARGEIGLLIIQVGLNQTPFLSEEAFVTAAWAIILNTIVGPVSVGVLLGRQRRVIYDDEVWGVQAKETAGLGVGADTEEDRKKGWRVWADRGVFRGGR
ncbi:related to Na+/H+ antiporter [Cephalotrichum gorgonifer]|uniref:Related to Na+/H+ antiporter n=1 Tax=Cephalotrichum gorgonifer TaxID=2041049 RepID=A0AAE8MXM6_9PEZI|nr:related to Na+/H+ antiporter [Cephalotrichum gorgonifer]